MNYIIREQQLVIAYAPGKGAWTYHLKIPGTKDIKGKWGDIKVQGTIDGYDIGCKNLMPHKGADKWMSVNDTIRKAINKSSGDVVTVTLYLKPANFSEDASEDVLECFRDADVLQKFTALGRQEQEAMLKDIQSQPGDAAHEKRILYYITQLESLSNHLP